MEHLPGTSEWRVVKRLLLLCLFVTNGEADCPIPKGRDVIVLTDEALLKNDFPEGSETTFECANGYVREHGSGTVTCIGGQWTEPDLTCKKKDCGPPKQLPNMNFQYIDGGTLFGASVKVVCNKGYEIRGPAYKHCYASGWTGRPRCEVVTCEKPGEITNGRNSWESDKDPRYGEVIQYFCDGGFILTGNSSIECNEDGEYNSQPPQCEAISCPSGDIPFSILTGEGPPFSFKSTASYKCEDGYTLQGASELVCEINGWSSPFPSCIRFESGTDILTTAVNVPLTEGTTPSTHTDTNTTTRDTSTDPPLIRGGKDSFPTEETLLLPEGTTTTDSAIPSTNHRFTTTRATSTPPTSIQDGFLVAKLSNTLLPTLGKRGEVDVNKDTGNTAVIASVIGTVIVVLIVLYILHRFHMKRKGCPNATTPMVYASGHL